MASVSGGGNYVSDGAIMAWLAKQQDRIYGDLRDSMKSSEARAEFANDLNDIKAGLHAANSSPSHDFTQVGQQLTAFMDKYASEPEFSELCQGLQGMVDKVVGDTVARAGYPKLQEAYQQQMAEFIAAGGDPTGPPVQFKLFTMRDNETLLKPEEPVPPPEQKYDDDTLRTWDELIGGKLDVAGKNDQINMIHIQQLKATIDQGSQFGSQFIASGDKTSNSIINNIA
jgi:hypothetical protein